MDGQVLPIALPSLLTQWINNQLKLAVEAYYY